MHTTVTVDIPQELAGEMTPYRPKTWGAHRRREFGLMLSGMQQA